MAARATRPSAGLHGAGRPAGLRLPGIVLGVGLGGFVDGILLHQVLQWHHMLSNTGDDRLGLNSYPPDTLSGLEMNTLWDGIFHAVCWVAVIVGLTLLYARLNDPNVPGPDRRRIWASRVLWGWMLVGWGLFNLAEGILDHHILAIHHVRRGSGEIWWDLGFLLLGLALVAAGWALAHSGPARDAATAATPGNGPTGRR
ncbi:MAG: DUF2243 domain-containing protein [Solirubrobacteraceae bacterium]|nr:DUF2243 domain-containing protein [Solirubrobacteraceae bacterium]